MNKKTTFDWKFILFLITFLALTIGIFIFVNRYNEEQASFVKEAKEKGLIEKSEKEKRLEEEEKERLEEERKRFEKERIQKEKHEISHDAVYRLVVTFSQSPGKY